MVERHWAWHSIIAFGQHSCSNDVGRGMTSPPLDSTHGRTKLGMTCHHHPCTARTVRRRQVWHAITALEKHTQSNDVRRCMKSPPLDCTHDRTMSGVTCHHHLWAAPSVERRLLWHVIIAVGQHTRLNDVVRGMISPPLENTHGRKKLGMTFHHRPCTARTIG